MLMDMEILKATKGQKDLDDLMKYLYNEFYLGKKRGFTDQEFKASVEKVSGKNFDEFFGKYVNGVDPIPYNDFLSTVGLRLADQNQGKKEVFFGVNTKNDAGKILVTSVVRGSCAYLAGINVNDEIVAIDNFRVDDLPKWIGYKKAGDKIKVTITREGSEKNIDVLLTESKAVCYKFEQVSNPSAEQVTAYNKWLKIK